MTNTYKDISEEIDKSLIDVLVELNRAGDEFDVSFLVIGARARDIFFSAMFDIPTPRATYDVDVAIRVESWSHFDKLKNALLKTGNFAQDKSKAHRLKYLDGTLVDILPFGKIENPPGTLVWPQESEKEMSTIGFEEAWRSSIIVKIRREPEQNIHLATPAALVIMKLIAWDEMYPERNNDAKDILFMMREYINAGNDARLYGEDKDLTEAKAFDYGLASPRLLGRDVTRIANKVTLSKIKNILEKETNDGSEPHLVQDMVGGSIDLEKEFTLAMKLLREFKRGLVDERR